MVLAVVDRVESRVVLADVLAVDEAVAVWVLVAEVEMEVEAVVEIELDHVVEPEEEPVLEPVELAVFDPEELAELAAVVVPVVDREVVAEDVTVLVAVLLAVLVHVELQLDAPEELPVLDAVDVAVVDGDVTSQSKKVPFDNWPSSRLSACSYDAISDANSEASIEPCTTSKSALPGPRTMHSSWNREPRKFRVSVPWSSGNSVSSCRMLLKMGAAWFVQSDRLEKLDGLNTMRYVSVPPC